MRHEGRNIEGCSGQSSTLTANRKTHTCNRLHVNYKPERFRGKKELDGNSNIFAVFGSFTLSLIVKK